MTGSDPPMAILGATASGKSAVAMEVARRVGGVEIVAVDAMQVYRGMDIGTATPPAGDQEEVAHHLLDLADPSEEFSVAEFQTAARRAIDEIHGRGRRPLLVAGTGLYLRAVVDELDLPGRWPEVRAELDAEPDTGALHRRLAGLDPAAAARMEPGNRRRIVRALEVTLGSGRPFSSFGPGLTTYPVSAVRQVGLRLPMDVLDARIERRVDEMLGAGFLDEVRALARRPEGLSRTAAQALGYRELLGHLAGRLTLDEARAEIVARTRRFARRQLRWFRRDPRIRWIEVGDNPLAAVPEVLGDWTSCT